MSAPSTAAAAGTFGLGGDLTVNRLGYGAMQLCGPGVMGPPKDRAEAIAVLREAVDLGVDHIDTSDYYGPYVVNDLIREALHPYPENLVLVTKVGARRTPDGGWPSALSAQELTDAVHDNLRRLGIEQIHPVNLRMAGPMNAVLREGSLAEPFETLAGLQQQGLIRHLGVSNVGRDQIIEAQAIAPVACVQNQFNVVQRDDEELVDLCAAEGMAFVPFFPLGGFTPIAADRFAAVADEIGATTMQLALAWLLQRSPAILCIPGTSTLAHLRENLAAGEIHLTADQLDELDRLAR